MSTTEDDHGFSDDDRRLSEDDVPFERFTASDFDDLDESDHEYPGMNVNFNDPWILL